MSQQSYNILSGILFLAIFLLHLARLSLGWDAVVSGVAIPMWASVIAILVAGFLSYTAFSLRE